MVMVHYHVYSAHDQVALQAAATSVAAYLRAGRVEVYAGGGDSPLGITIHDVQWPEWCLFHQRIFKSELSRRFIALRMSGAIDPGM